MTSAFESAKITHGTSKTFSSARLRQEKILISHVCQQNIFTSSAVSMEGIFYAEVHLLLEEELFTPKSDVI